MRKAIGYCDALAYKKNVNMLGNTKLAGTISTRKNNLPPKPVSCKKRLHSAAVGGGGAASYFLRIFYNG